VAPAPHCLSLTGVVSGLLTSAGSIAGISRMSCYRISSGYLSAADPGGRSARCLRHDGSGSPHRAQPIPHPSIQASWNAPGRTSSFRVRGVIQQRLVDVELVAFWIGQRDRIVIQALLDDRVQPRSTERHEPRRLSLDPLAPGVERRTPATARVHVDVDAVL
jgi:hypothetical protein